MPHSDKKELAKYEVDARKPVHKQQDFFSAFLLMVEQTRAEEITDQQSQMLRVAMSRHDVKPRELYEAFWDAYEDHYTPKDGIQWRHLWKHISKRREQTYTPPDMPEQLHPNMQDNGTDKEDDR